jgi:hypothetical protein
VASLGVLAVLSCAAPLGVIAPGAERYDPPVVYQEWWADVEACTGKAGNVTRVTWYLADSIDCGDNLDVRGCWERPHTIYIQRPGKYIEGLIKHEMIHDLVQVAGHGPVFDRCT